MSYKYTWIPWLLTSSVFLRSREHCYTIQNNTLILFYTILFIRKLFIIYLLITSFMWLFTYVNIMSRQNVPHGWRVTERWVTTTHSDILKSADSGLDAAVQNLFNLHPPTCQEHNFIPCLQNLPLSTTLIHLSSFYHFNIKITPLRKIK